MKSNEGKRTQVFKFHPHLAWRQLMGKNEYITNIFIDLEMEQYAHKLYMRNGIMPITLSMKTTYNACFPILGERL